MAKEIVITEILLFLDSSVTLLRFGLKLTGMLWLCQLKIELRSGLFFGSICFCTKQMLLGLPSKRISVQLWPVLHRTLEIQTLFWL